MIRVAEREPQRPEEGCDRRPTNGDRPRLDEPWHIGTFRRPPDRCDEPERKAEERRRKEEERAAKQAKKASR